MKKVMLIGDSIRLIGYQKTVQKELAGEFEVWGSGDNCRFAKYTLNELERMLKACGKPDIIHWNNGLWDTAIVCKEDGAFTQIEEYINYMSKILRELRKVTDKIVFATITPVKPGSLNQDNDIINEYNKHIVAFMKKENIMINDLNALVAQNVEEYICADCIHLSDAGKEVCGKAVAEYIRKVAES